MLDLMNHSHKSRCFDPVYRLIGVAHKLSEHSLVRVIKNFRLVWRVRGTGHFTVFVLPILTPFSSVLNVFLYLVNLLAQILKTAIIKP